MSTIVIAPLLVALFTAIATLALRRWGRLQRAVSLLGSVAYLGAVGLLVRAVRADEAGYLVYQLSNWDAPYGISLVADDLSALMLALTAVIGVLAAVFSVRAIDERGQRLSYHPLYHLMLVGITGSFLTGDVFNLFVWFEVMLMSSYVLVVFYSGPEETRAALHYVVLNLIGSAVMLLAIGGLYATTGTLNMADMARRLAAPAQYGVDLPAVLGLSALLFSVFALKAGIVPFQFWVPDAYRAAPAPVAAMLAGVVKKVGVYAIVRLYFTVFAAASLPDLLGLGLTGGAELGFLAFYGPVFFLMALGSIVIGGVGAVGRRDLDGLLAYSSIGQVGFIVLPLAVAAAVPAGDPLRTLGVVAALVYVVNHGIAKSLLFLVSGTIQGAVGSVDFEDLGGLAEREPVLSGAFFVGALALIGIPPLSGFFGKLLVFDTAAQARSAPVLAVSLGGAVLTIAYFTLAWSRGFWGEPGMAVEGTRADRSLVGVTAVLAALIVVLGIGFGPLLDLAREAALAATETHGYIDAVLGGNA